MGRPVFFQEMRATSAPVEKEVNSLMSPFLS